MLQVAFNLNRLVNLFGGDFRPVLEVARLADEKGVDQIVIGDHLALIPEGYGNYPHGTFPNAPDAPMAEGLTTLAAIAAVTRRARLSMNVLISPLRSALLLAKQLAMVDVISHGRVDAAIGAGWLREEFEAAEMPFEGRFAYMEEQVAAWRVLWRDCPANFEGKRVRFRNLFMLPQPIQGADLPIIFGVSASERGVERMARLADGWTTPPMPDAQIQAGITALHQALRARGRDPAKFAIRSQLSPVRKSDGSIDVDASFARAATLERMGVTMVTLAAEFYSKSPADLEPLMDRLMKIKTG